MTPEDNIIYNRLVHHDHRIREKALYLNLFLVSSLRESKQSHNIIIYGTNKYNTYNGFTNRKPVKYEGKFFFNFNRQIEPVRPEQDNNSNAAIIEFAKICLDEIVKYGFLFMVFESIRTSYKNNPCYPGFGSHFIYSFYFIFFDFVNIPPVLIRLNAHPGPTHFAKPRHNQSLLIPGRISTPGCDRGGAFVLATKAFTMRLYCEETQRKEKTFANWQFTNRLAFNFLTNIPFLLSTGPGETPSPGPAQHHAQLIRTSFKFNKLRNVFSDREKSIMITSKSRDVSGPCHISPTKYHGLRTHGFWFYFSREGHEETRRNTKKRQLAICRR